MALHKLVLDDMELTALITHLQGQSEMMCESRANSSYPDELPDREEVLLNLVYAKAFTIGWDAHINQRSILIYIKTKTGFTGTNDNITFYFLKNDTLTNCQVEDISFYSDTMGVEFTIQDTSEVEEEVDV